MITHFHLEKDFHKKFRLKILSESASDTLSPSDTLQQLNTLAITVFKFGFL